ncbi:helix-turn-helix domain-containing protein [Janthinobacterium agaricidamnosum]|uniref:HTH araC/xylS-type domain-containing protein n=1 Tax=Janthinobacterium agaricidamnosum NBRC 102515 = DSM 9628 TaxID=1349767 RepID=W0V940_9BURK|nr:helix-turn-helix domain-containing protein [Janthinobacterium agaricidamnosum]CDG85344.1 hypothetical protein GJA_4740 [Janthinobacterium agaricidamnosum NBRC 102515 = DSM 9628]
MPSLPITRLIAPRLSLASCVRAYLGRSTIDSPLLPPGQRLNRFPATPLCGIGWVLQGESEVAAPGLGLDIKMPAILYNGPQSKPMVSYNPGPVRSFFLLFFPSALHRLTGIDISTQLDQFYLPEEVFDASWLAMFQAVAAAPDDAARVALIEDFLDPLWAAVRTGDDGGRVADWVRRLGVQAAASGLGNGARSIERRIKAWAGQPMRTLRRMSRAEQAFFASRTESIGGKVAWTEIAARSAYADQAHLCRETREITGLTPTELIRASEQDESYWVYRIWS